MQDESKRSTMLKNFLPFGAGIRACPAAEFVKLFVTLTLHILVMEYRCILFAAQSMLPSIRSCTVLVDMQFVILPFYTDGKKSKELMHFVARMLCSHWAITFDLEHRTTKLIDSDTNWNAYQTSRDVRV